MILCELLTNVFKYAFPDGRSGTADVSVTAADGHMHLDVSDDGVGLPQDFDPSSSSSFGWQLIRNLTAQLGVPPGSFARRHAGGDFVPPWSGSLMSAVILDSADGTPRTKVFIVEDEALIAMEVQDRLSALGYPSADWHRGASRRWRQSSRGLRTSC